MNKSFDYIINFLLLAISALCIACTACMVKIFFFQSSNGGYETVQLMRYSGDQSETYAGSKEGD